MFLIYGRRRDAAIRAILDALDAYPHTPDWDAVRDLVAVHMAAAYGCRAIII